jgi:N-acyl-D-aspartate/D-glutamate deacylase
MASFDLVIRCAGEITYREGQFTGALPGRLVRRAGLAPVNA